MALPWLVPLSLLPLPVLATGELPPRPSEVPLEVPVGDLGQNDRLPESLRALYRPAGQGPWATPWGSSPRNRPPSAGGRPTPATPGGCIPAST